MAKNQKQPIKLTGKDDGSMADPFNAGGGADTVLGKGGDDWIDGGKGSDVLKGNGGNDHLISNEGNDELIGGGGNDTAHIGGNFADAVVTENADGTQTIAINGRTITTKTIENFAFDDKTVSAADLVNDAPTGAATAVIPATNEDTSFVVSEATLLEGFSDSNTGDSLSVTGLTASNATVVDNGDGTYTITPAADFNGSITLNYNVEDQSGASVAGTNTVAVTAVNDAPTGTSTGVLAAGTEDTAYVVKASDLLTGITDADGDTLTVSNLKASDGAVVKDNGDGTFTITPAADDNGPITLTFDAVDGKGGTLAATNTFNLAAANDAPTGTSTATLANGTEDTAYVVKGSDLVQGFSDKDGDTLTVSNLKASDGATVKDNGDGTFTITPAANDNGDVTLTFDVVDGKGGSTAGTNKVNFVAVEDTFTLTKDTDTPALTTDGEVINGVVSALSTENTLNALDVIVDTGGTDTLKVDLKADFGGFSGTGKMTGVENIALSNTGGVARTFTATGITGDKAYSLTGAVNLAGLTSISTVAAGTRTADLSIGYAAAAVAGAADTLALSVTGFGVADNPATTNVNEQDDVKITVAGIETTNLTATGVNVLDLSGLASSKINVAGAGTTTITKLNAGTSSIDGSAATGAMTVNTSGALAATTIATGTGNDTITTNLSTELAANATVSGGSGTDTLVVTGGTGATVQLAQSGIETLALGAVGGAVTMSLKNTTGLTGVVAYGDGNAAGALAQDVVLANVGAGSLAINLQGANANGNKSITSDGTGSTVITVDTPAATATDAAPSVNALDVILNGASSVDLTVASKMSYTGQITATKATSVNVNLQGSAGATSSITAASATSVVISSVAAASDIDIVASKATSLDINNAKNLLLKDTTDFSSLENLKSTGAGDLDMTGIALSKLNSGTITNAGVVTLNNLGSTTLGYGVTLNATGSKSITVGKVETLDQAINLSISSLGAIVAGNIDADDLGSVTLTATSNSTLTTGTIKGNNVTVDASAVLGKVDLGNVTAYGNLSISGSTLVGTDMSGDTITLNGSTAQSVTLKGGIGVDKFYLTAGTNNTGITVTGDLDVGADEVKVIGSNKASTLSLAGLTNYDTGTITGGDLVDTITGGSGVDTITGGKGNDTLSGGAGADVYVFGATGANNGTDALTFVTGTGGDVFNFKAFIAAGSLLSTTPTDAAATGNTAINDKVALLGSATVTSIDDASEIAALIEGAGDAFDLGAGGKAVVISGDPTGAANTMRIWYVDSSLDGTAGDVTATDVVLVGTVAATELDTLVAGNFQF